MSGICGIIYFDGREVEDELQHMVHPLSHRGPDGIKLYRNGSVGLAHLMLHVTHESLYEQQPLVSSSGLVLVADARVDNRKELYAQLGLDKTTSPLRLPDGTIIAEQPLSHLIQKSISDEPTDAELILAAYQKWGDGLLYHLVGDFAFALWDENRQSFICGRDHSGIRTFYYFHKPGVCFAFASELKALLALPEVPKQLNEEKAAVYLSALTGYRFYHTDTMFKHIKTLHFSQLGIFNSSSSELKLNLDFQLERFSHLKTPEDFAECFKVYFEEAVACRIRTPFGIGSHLSGGLDSSSVSCLAQNHLEKQGRQLNTFHLKTNLPMTDETAYVEYVLNLYPSMNHVYTEAHADFYGSMNIYHQCVGYPETLPLDFHNFRPLYETMLKNSNRVLLTGHDGDTVVGHGGSYLRGLLKEKKWTLFKRAISGMIEKNGSTDKQRDGTLLRYCFDELAQQPLSGKLFYLSKMAICLIQRPSLLGKSLIYWWEKVTLILNFSPASALVLPSFLNKKRVNEVLQRIYQPAYDDDNLHILKDNLQNSGSLVNTNELLATIGSYYLSEINHPFLDKRLRELCMAIPPEFKFDNGWKRGPLRRAMVGVLPEEVRTRTSKVEFTPYVYHFWANVNPSWLVNFHTQKHLYREYLDTEMLEKNEQLLHNDLLPVSHKIPLYQSLMFSYFFINWLDNYFKIRKRY
ncbi:asparagine synthase-related protein [Runella slithyformis]|uniref:asparagine synthase (glutamine-hydrolyzing) n=1 Tax=Runella slithyformis (strain ATCC 29530 / DSM 19594 / LMG 11500 / NCIMB 11436 / LSU 4) TaxID=761193 RepID=A0A7U3ZPD6_RUNSL|nr:asparagine synthase-related protein [Runella slithyformis]AEI50914.1 Asparagine synthase (glutamine-hydrolyzing) [Runella slithyformis DSM 19594]